MGKLTISIPTGRMKEESLALLSRLPQCPPLDFVNSRRLVVEQEDLPWRIIFLTPKTPLLMWSLGQQILE